jgi:predicted RNA-binding Zn-ribbon protein involved in translation (DUF1610 family)
VTIRVSMVCPKCGGAVTRDPDTPDAWDAFPCPHCGVTVEITGDDIPDDSGDFQWWYWLEEA